MLPGGGGLVSKSCLTLMTPWTVPCQAPLPMGFSRQEYRSGLPFPSLGDLHNLGIKSGSPELQSDSFIFFLQADSLPAMSDLQLIEHQLCRA